MKPASANGRTAEGKPGAGLCLTREEVAYLALAIEHVAREVGLADLPEPASTLLPKLERARTRCGIGPLYGRGVTF